MPAWPLPAQRVLIVLAAGLLALGLVLGGWSVPRQPAVTVADDSRLELRLDINSASAGDLETLPGVGQKLAGRLVAHRAEHGPFKRVDDLLLVSGFGEKLVGTLRPYVTVR